MDVDLRMFVVGECGAGTTVKLDGDLRLSVCCRGMWSWYNS